MYIDIGNSNDMSEAKSTLVNTRPLLALVLLFKCVTRETSRVLMKVLFV